MDRLLWCFLLLNVFKLAGRIWATVKLPVEQSFLSPIIQLRSNFTLFRFYQTLFARGWNNHNSPLLILVGITNSDSCLSQPDQVFWRKIGQSVELPCTISAGCSGRGWKYEWFLCKESSCRSVKLHENPHKYKLNGASLHVTALQANDSGIYHCAAVSAGGQGSQHVGLGTTLVVKGRRGK